MEFKYPGTIDEYKIISLKLNNDFYREISNNNKDSKILFNYVK